MKLLNLALSALCVVTFTGFARAQDDDSEGQGHWLVRLRAEGIIPQNHSAPFSFQNENFYGYELHLTQKIAFEGDISYFFTKNFALEASVNAPPQQTLTLGPVGNLGTIDLLIPMITAQYHFVTKKSPISPYVGVGMAWNHVQSQDFSVTGNLNHVTQDTSGFVLQVGVDIEVSNGFYINLDFKHVQMIPNLKDTSGNILTDANISPNIIAIGVGHRF